MPRMSASRSVRTRTSGRPEPESAFDHPAFEGLYSRVLADVAARRLEPAAREAAARALAFMLRERVVDEAVATQVLTALHRSIDLPQVVRALLVGLRDTLGDHEKITEWTKSVAERAIRERQLAAFIVALRILTDLRHYDGGIPTGWRLSLLRAIETKDLAPRVALFARTYARRFPDDCWWLRTVRRQSAIASLRWRVVACDFAEPRDS